MKNSKKSMVLVVLTILCLSILAACSSRASGSSNSTGMKEEVIIKVGHVVTENDPYHLGLVKMKEIVESKTEGRYKLEIHANAQLGSERDLIEGVQLGSIGMAVTATGPVGSFVKELSVVELPFLIRDYEHADRVFMGEIGQELSDMISKTVRVKSLGFWENGFRSLVNNGHSVETVEDIAGLKIRTMENPIHIAAWKALGADPVPMAWGDAYTGVQQGALDGLENAICLLYSLKTSEITKYLAVTEHVYSASSVLLNAKIWEGMSDTDKAIFEDAFKEASIYEREVARKQASEAEKKLEEEGLIVTHPDKEGFVKLTKDVKNELNGDYVEIINRIEKE